MPANPKSNTITLARIFDAPVETVWDAWADPDQVAQWWGPRGFTLTTHSKDLRPGGLWHYTMHGPDGTDYHIKTPYLEVEKHAKLVYDHGGYDDRPPLFRVTVLFSPLKGKTKMEMTVTLPSAEAAEETRKFIKKAGGDTTWDRLAEYLEKTSSGKEKFFITRSFDTSIATMFEVWTDPKHVALWTPPTGATMEFIRVDIKSGGSSFYKMTWSNGLSLYGKVNYQKIQKPDALVYTQQFCDENGKPSRHPMAPSWPETVLTTVTLAEEGPQRTRVTVCWEPDGASTDEELKTFTAMRGGVTQGWTGSFDKLEAHLAGLC